MTKKMTLKERAAKLEKALRALVEKENGRYLSRVGLAWDVTEEVGEVAEVVRW